MALLDDYVGVSNTNMHLRAGLGLTARVLVPLPPEWRWQADAAESPWFPGFAIYRQTHAAGWARRSRAFGGISPRPCPSIEPREKRRHHGHHRTGSAATHDRAPRDLPRRDARPHAPDHERADVAGDDRRDHDRPARQEGDDRRDHRRRAGDARARGARPREEPGEPRRRGRHRRRRRAHLQHLERRDVRLRRRGRPGGEARQPRGLVEVWQRRRDGGARREHQPHPGAGRPLHRRGRRRLHVRARTTTRR